MRVSVRLRALVLAAVCAASALGSASALARPLVAPVPLAVGSAGAIEQLGACFAARKAGDLLLLMDQSGSLQKTDPTATRVTAAKYLLSQLTRYSEKSGVAVDVAVSGFDAAYVPTVPWQRLTSAALPSLQEGVQAFAQRDDGLDTDYVAALSGVRDDLRSRQRASAAPRCQAVVWLSDGQFDIDPRRGTNGSTKPYAPGVTIKDVASAAAAVQAGKRALCRSGGVTDQLRSGGTLTFAVGLGSDPSTFQLMSAAATGRGTPACGKATSDVVGDFRLASDVEGMIFALDKLSQPGISSLDLTTGVCPTTACATERHDFVLDASVRSVHILAGADQPGIDVVLSPPGGGPATRFHHSDGQPAIDLALAGQRVTGSWISGQTLQLDLARSSAAGWVGQWSVVFIDPTGTAAGARARTQIGITGDLLPALLGSAPVLRSGDPVTLRLGLLSEATGRPVPAASVLGKALLSAVLVNSDGSTRTLIDKAAPATLAAGTVLDLKGVAPGPTTLRLILSVQTAGLPAAGGRPALSGTQLADRQVDVALTVLSPFDFPSVVSSTVDFGQHEGTGPFPATVVVRGPGCVWLGPATVDASPDGVRAATITSSAAAAGSCLTVAKDATATLPLLLRLDGTGNGTVAGQLVIELAPAGAPDRALPGTLPFAADLQRPVNTAVALGVFVLALLLGIGLPLAFLYLAKRFAAKMPGEGLLAGALPVQVVGSSVLRNGQPFTFTTADLNFVPVPESGTRRLRAAGLDLRSRTGWSPTSAGYTQVQAGAAAVITSAGSDRLPLAVHNTWVAFVALTDPGEVHVVPLLSATGTNADSIARLAAQVRDQIPGLIARLRSEAGLVEPPPVPTSGWGAPSPTDGPAAQGGPPTVTSWGASSPTPTWGTDRPSAPPTWGAPPST